jgi:hypothetical protein
MFVNHTPKEIFDMKKYDKLDMTYYGTNKSQVIEQSSAKPEKEKKKKVYIKKQQFDTTSSIFYSLGCSLVHLSMFITIWFVKPPNTEMGKIMDQSYTEQFQNKTGGASSP